MIAAQNNTIKTNHILARMYKTQENSICTLCGDRDETINHMMSKCSKFSLKENKTRHGWWVKRSTMNCERNLNLTIRVNGICTSQHQSWRTSRKLLWNPNGLVISVRRPDLVIIKNQKRKKTCKIVDFAIPPDYRVKLKEGKKKDNYQDLTRVQKKLLNMKVTFIPTIIGALLIVTKELIKGLEDLGIRRQVDTIQTTT